MQTCLQMHGIDSVSLITTNVVELCKVTSLSVIFWWGWMGEELSFNTSYFLLVKIVSLLDGIFASHGFEAHYYLISTELTYRKVIFFNPQNSIKSTC